MKNNESKHVYDLEERTYVFTKNVCCFIKSLPKTLANYDDGKQIIRSSVPVGAYYIEANEALSKKKKYNNFRF